MKAIILSAGQGRRLLPLTQNTPKSLLPDHDGNSLLQWQLSQLERAGISEVIIISGFNAQKIRDDIQSYKGSILIQEVYNPFFELADNLGSVWVGLQFLRNFHDDFIVLNGDTMFTYDVAERLIAANDFPITLTISHKDQYDDDDMKVITKSGHLLRVGKKLPMDTVNGESIGMMKFSGDGVSWFKREVFSAMESQEGLKTWYLSVLDHMAQTPRPAENCIVGTMAIEGDRWCEVDFPVDYQQARENIARWKEADRASSTSTSSSSTSSKDDIIGQEDAVSVA